jgi:para-nitrobenzyl esterase
MTSRLRKLLAMPLFVVGVALVTGCGAPGLDQVQLDSGPISGTHEAVGGQGIWTFKGVPYAAPPVGELRWQAPRPVKPCPQPAMLEVFSLSAGRTDEDCLYLNVWSPAKSANERLPVMVWIHGGSFETGSGSMDVYNGGYLATEGVVVVTINYRLGPLGFLSHPALSAQAESGVCNGISAASAATRVTSPCSANRPGA